MRVKQPLRHEHVGEGATAMCGAREYDDKMMHKQVVKQGVHELALNKAILMSVQLHEV